MSLDLSVLFLIIAHIAGSFLNREMGQEVVQKITPKGKSQKFETPKSLKGSQGTPIMKDKSKRKINLEDMNDDVSICVCLFLYFMCKLSRCILIVGLFV